MEIKWNADICSHSANCVKSLPKVFKVENGKFVIDPKGADEKAIRETVKNCPSKALRIE